MEENEKLRARVNTLSDSCLAYHHANAGLKTERDQLKAEVDRLTKEKSDAETRMREEYTKRQIVEKENESLKLELEKQIEFLQALTRIK